MLYEGWSSIALGYLRYLYLWYDGCLPAVCVSGRQFWSPRPTRHRPVSLRDWTLVFGGRLHVEMAMTQLIINLRYCLMSFSCPRNSGVRSLVSPGNTSLLWYHRWNFGISGSVRERSVYFYNYGSHVRGNSGWTLELGRRESPESLLPDFMFKSVERCHLRNVPLAIIIPPSKRAEWFLGGWVASMAVSTVLVVTPVLKQVSSGFMIINHNTSGSRPLAAYFARWKRRRKPFMSHNVYLYIPGDGSSHLVHPYVVPFALAKMRSEARLSSPFCTTPYACLAAGRSSRPSWRPLVTASLGRQVSWVALIAGYMKKPDHSSPVGMCGGVYRGEGSGIIEEGYAEIGSRRRELEKPSFFIYST